MYQMIMPVIIIFFICVFIRYLIRKRNPNYTYTRVIKELTSNEIPPEIKPARAYEPVGFIFGQKGLNFYTKKETEEGHILIVGGAGSGKSSSLIIPSMLTWKARIFAIDIKGELKRETAHARKNVKFFDPYDLNTYGYDPFYILKTSDNKAKAIDEIVYSLVPRALADNSKDPFWIESEQNLLKACILYFTNPGFNYSFTETIKKIVKTPINTLIDKLKSSSSEDVIIASNQFMAVKEEQLASIHSGLCNKIKVFAEDKELIKALSKTKNIDVYENGYGYDPLYAIKTSHNKLKAIDELVFFLIPDSIEDSNQDPFYIKTQQSLLRACILYFTNPDFNYSFTETIKEIIETPINQLMNEFKNSSWEHVIMLANRLLIIDERLLVDAYEKLCDKIKVFTEDKKLFDPFLKEKNIDIYENIIRPCDLENDYDIYFIIRESDLERWSNFLSLVVNQFIKFFEERGEDKKDKPILFALDEFPRLGKINNIKGSLGTLRSKGITICIVIQSLAQLEDIYGDVGSRLIVDNCSYKAILRVSEPKSQKYFADLLGTHPVRKVTHTISENSNAQAVSEAREYKTFPEELAYITQVLLFTPFGATWIDKTPYFSHPVLKNLSS